MRILFIQRGKLSDIIFSTPVFRTVKVQLDDAVVMCLTTPAGVVVLRENPYIDHLAEHESSLPVKSFSYIIDLESSLSSRWLSYRLKGGVSRVKSKWWKEWLLARLKINKIPNLHQVDRFFEAVSALGVKTDELSLDYFLPEKDYVDVQWLPGPFRREYVALCLTAAYSTRRLPVNRIIELCDRINKPVILVGTQEDYAMGEVISNFFDRKEQHADWEEGLKELNKKTIIFNACGKFNFNQTASIVKQARYVFTFDNEYIAVASAFRKYVFTIWGNTVLTFGRYPYQTRFMALENNRLSCRPCSSKGYDQCPLGHFKCMNDIVFDFYLP
jgi:ADP-heptose:LPS heptosyltransferase